MQPQLCHHNTNPAAIMGTWPTCRLQLVSRTGLAASSPLSQPPNTPQFLQLYLNFQDNAISMTSISFACAVSSLGKRPCSATMHTELLVWVRRLDDVRNVLGARMLTTLSGNCRPPILNADNKTWLGLRILVSVKPRNKKLS